MSTRKPKQAKIFGGLDARTPVEGTGIAGVDEAVGYVLKEVTRYGEDIRLSYSKSIKK